MDLRRSELLRRRGPFWDGLGTEHLIDGAVYTRAWGRHSEGSS